MQAEQEFSGLNISPLAERVTAGIGAVAMAGGATVGIIFDPTKSNFYPLCPLYTITGLACPGCGLTRGFHALFHGDVITAIDFNALIPVWAVIFVWVLISLTLLAIRGRGLPMWPTNPKFMWAFLVVLVTFGVLRNIPLWPLTILFP